MPQPSELPTITLERFPSGIWVATARTEAGEVTAQGHTLLEARLAITRLLVPQLSADVQEGKLASAIFLASVSLAIGMLNSAAMTL